MFFNLQTSLRVFAVAALVALPVSLNAAEKAASSDESPLHQTMEKMGQTMRTLGRGLRNPVPTDKATYLESLQTLQTLAIEAKAYTPASIEKLPEADRPKQLAAFRSDLAGAIETMLQIERAVLAEDWDTVKTLNAKLGQQRNESHKKYDPEE